MKEIWKDIAGCEGFIISNTGKVINKKTAKEIHKTESVWSSELNLEKRSIHKNTKIVNGRMVRMDQGYVTAMIKGKSYRVHRLVAQAFLSLDDNPEQIGITKAGWDRMEDRAKDIIKDAMQVNHKDHDKENNNVWNLDWMTPQENSKHNGEYRKNGGTTIPANLTEKGTLEDFFS